jgi:hypothetical protein
MYVDCFVCLAILLFIFCIKECEEKEREVPADKCRTDLFLLYHYLC